MDAVVTGVILSGIVASIYGVKKLRSKEDETLIEEIKNILPMKKKSFFDKILRR